MAAERIRLQLVTLALVARNASKSYFRRLIPYFATIVMNWFDLAFTQPGKDLEKNNEQG